MTRILTKLCAHTLASWETTYPWHLQAGVCRVGQSSTATVDADRDTADQVAHANRDTSPEERESGVVVVRRVHVLDVASDLCGEYNGDDDPCEDSNVSLGHLAKSCVDPP